MMQKYFTKGITQPLKVIILGLAIGLGVSFVSANWTAPLSTAPNCTSGDPGCDAPINVSTTPQIKGGTGLIQNAMLYVKQVLGADHIVAVQSFNAGSASSSLMDGNANVYGQFKIDRSSSFGTAGTDLLNLKGGTPNADYVSVLQNKPWFQIWNYGNNQRASLLARSAQFDIDAQDQDTLIQANRGGVPGFIVDPGYVAGSVVDVTVNGRLKINDGTQGAGKVFTSDANGLGSWSNLTGTGGGMEVITVGHTRPNVTNMTQFNTEAYCPTTHPILLGGGSDCQYPYAVRESHPVFAGNQRPPTGQNADYISPMYPLSGWRTVCAGPSSTSGHDAHAWAICGKTNPVTISVAAPTTPSNPTATWQWLPTSSGNEGQSCTAWLASSQPTATSTKAFVNLNKANPIPSSAASTTGGSVGACAYEYTVELALPDSVHSKCAVGDADTGIVGARPVAYCIDTTSQVFLNGNPFGGIVTYEIKTAVLKP